MAKMRDRFFLAFDISSDKRRAKLTKILEKFGVRVQYSIFEFWLTKARKIEFFGKLKQEEFFDHKGGESLLIVPIPSSIEAKIERYGGTSKIFEEPCIISI